MFQGSELSEFEPSYLVEDEAQLKDSVATRAVSIARAELGRWNPSPKSKRKETDPAMRDALRAYWGAVVSAKEIESCIDNRYAWSAAFISWIMVQAGAGSAFKYSAAHRVYVSAAKAAREAAERNRYWAYRVSEVTPEPGDIVCRDRGKEGAPCGGATYENINDGTQWATHGDVVVTLRKGKIEVVGGNLDDSVGSHEIALDADSRVIQPAGCKYFAILKAPAPFRGDIVGGARPEAHCSALAPIATAIRNGSLPIEAGLAIAAGNRSENELTNLVFYVQHPEVPPGQKINASERALVQDWIRIRDQVVRPLLRQFPGG